MSIDGWTCCGSAGVEGATEMGVDQVPPPSFDHTTRISEPAVGSHRIGLVELLMARNTRPPSTVVVGWLMRRVTFSNPKEPNRPGTTLLPCFRTSRRPLEPQSFSLPGVTFGKAKAS